MHVDSPAVLVPGPKGGSMMSKANMFHHNKAKPVTSEKIVKSAEGKSKKKKTGAYYDDEEMGESQSSYGSHIISDNRHTIDSEDMKKKSEQNKEAEVCIETQNEHAN